MSVPLSYLKERITVDSVLKEYDFETCHPSFKAGWEGLLSQRCDGDELWRYDPPTRNSTPLWGIALVRDGQIVATLATAIS